MTTFNTDYSNTELLDQELTIEELEAVAGGLLVPIANDYLALPMTTWHCYRAGVTWHCK